ncbi:MAG: GntR family transcriptional regulator [Rhodospirillales bacterium]|jgi:DNA-binding GntR family transcriptional regulator
MDAIVESRVDCSTLRKINLRQPMVPQVYAALRALIIDLTWKPGQIVAKDDVAEALGVSQSPVREALLKLEEDGLIVVVPRSRTVVSMIDVRHAMEAQFLRLSVEVEVVRTIAARKDAEAHFAELAALLKHQEIFAGHGAFAEFAASDNEFHLRLYRLAGVERLWALVNARRSHIDRLRHLDLPSRGKLETVLRDHAAILAALGDGNAAKAEAAIRSHLAGTLGRAQHLKAKFPEYFDEE